MRSKTGEYFPCRVCGELQYRKPSECVKIQTGMKAVFCRPCYLGKMREIRNTPVSKDKEHRSLRMERSIAEFIAAGDKEGSQRLQTLMTGKPELFDLPSQERIAQHVKQIQSSP